MIGVGLITVTCDYCGKNEVYTCGCCGKSLCAEHARIRTVCSSCMRKITFKYMVGKVVLQKDREKIRDYVQQFWGEHEQITFDNKFLVAELPAYAAKLKGTIIGFASFADLEDAILIVALGVLPKYQGLGVGKRLMEKVELEALRTKKKRLLVSTSNDNLPALLFYQSLGFQIYEVKPNAIAEKHGKIMKGVAGLPIRDELRLQKLLD